MTNHLSSPLPMIDLSLPTIPPRSRLYPLTPMGTGTSEVESLTSYLSRLVYAHHVTAGNLAKVELAPLVNKSGKTAQGKFSYSPQNLNGIGVWTEMTIDALEKLTCQDNLCFLTMYPWRDVFARQKLLRHHLAWCPVCYHDWQQAGQTIYNPLLWALDVVKVCPHHQEPLHQYCPYPDCRKQLGLVNNQVKLGYCSFCRRWLGSTTVSEKEFSDSDSGWQESLWIATQLGELLAIAPTLPVYPQLHLLTQNLRMYIEVIASKKARELAREIGMSASPISDWLRGNPPQLDMLVKVCYHLKISLPDLLTPVTSDVQANNFTPENSAHPIDVNHLRSQLEYFLSDEQASPYTAQQVAKQLKLNVTSLRRCCPDEYQQLIKRSKQYQQVQRQAKISKLEHDLRAVLESEETPPPAMKEVARRLQIHPATARGICPELCRLIAQRRKTYYETRKLKAETGPKEILTTSEEPPPCQPATNDQPPPKMSKSNKSKDHVQLHRQFADILIDGEKEPPPSLIEVSQQLGCSVSTLREHHLDLCRQLRQKWNDYRQAQLSLLEHQLRKILEYNTPPSPEQVSKWLGVNSETLRKHLPTLYAQVADRYQACRQAERDRRQQFLDQIVSNDPMPPPSLSGVAKSLNTEPSALVRQFPEASRVIVERYRTYRQKERDLVRTALITALTTDQHPPLLPIQVARQLGYQNSTYLLIYFPDLCRQLLQRHKAYQKERVSLQLETILADTLSEPPSLERVSQQLGYNCATLKNLCPELCQVIMGRRQAYWDERKLAIKDALESVLTGRRVPPTSVKGIAKEFGCHPDTIRHYFPELTAAVSKQYKAYIKERGQQRIADQKSSK